MKILHNEQIFTYIDSDKIPDGVFRRYLLVKDKKRKYFRRQDHNKTVVHWGQRKLLLSEVEFLTKFSNDDDIVLYVGAAGGLHIILLSLMFPKLNFVLFDKTKFECINSNKIHIYNRYFTDKDAHYFKKYADRLLFISDIRSVRVRDTLNIENVVYEDMSLQQEWYNIINPKKSMFKFRLHWNDDVTSYIKGKLYLPVWGPKTTTESRLIIDSNAGTKDYSNKDYEEQMFYFNTITRCLNYKHIDVNLPVIDNCYDCACEIYIWSLYYERYNINYNKLCNIIKHIKNSNYNRRVISSYLNTDNNIFLKEESKNFSEFVSRMIIYSSYLCSKFYTYKKLNETVFNHESKTS